MTRTIGLVVNPIAGMGGRVGLKGTDGRLAATASEAGAVASACPRASVAIEMLRPLGKELRILSCEGDMGARAVADAGMVATIVNAPLRGDSTSAEDTKETVRRIMEHSPSLLLFAGGDGTARDLLDVVGADTPVLGIPAGVKMHSSVFAASPRAAGQVALEFLRSSNPAAMLERGDVLDRECGDASSPELYGSLTIPRMDLLVPGAKATSRITDRASLEGALERVRDMIGDERVNLIGPGSTMQALKRSLGFAGTPLGVDAVCKDRVLGTDLGESDILALIDHAPARMVLSVVGGQGFLFGRGNQPFSPEVIRRVGLENIVVVASQEKLVSLPGGSLLVDTGDTSMDGELAGYLPVLVSARRSVMMPVRSTSDAAPDKPAKVN
jgi:predicted polyphosphate/ATP-dependent NAD kinase